MDAGRHDVLVALAITLWQPLAQPDSQPTPVLHGMTMYHSAQGHHLSTSKSPLASPDLSRLNPAAA